MAKNISSSLPPRLHTSRNSDLMTYDCSSEPSSNDKDPQRASHLSQANSSHCAGPAKKRRFDGSKQSGSNTSQSQVDCTRQCELQETHHSSASQNLETITPHRPLIHQPEGMAQEIRKTNELLGELIQHMKKYKQRVKAIEEKLEATLNSCSSANTSSSRKGIFLLLLRSVYIVPQSLHVAIVL